MAQNKRYILIVDDALEDALLIRRAFAKAGGDKYAVVHAQLLSEALSCVTKQRFDVILLDLKLPDNAGIDGIRTLQQASNGATIIVLSGNHSPNIAAEAIAAGAKDFMLKDPTMGPIPYAVELCRARDILAAQEQQLLARTNELQALKEKLDCEIEERKRIKEELAKTESYYRTLFDLSTAGILLQDEKGNILEANDAICKTFGYSRDELVGKNVRVMVPPEYHSEIDRNIAEILSGKTLDHEVVNCTKDGSRRRYRLRERAITLPNSGRHIIVSAEDITHQRRTMEDKEISGPSVAT